MEIQMKKIFFAQADADINRGTRPPEKPIITGSSGKDIPCFLILR
jgi:hypothetical protein